MTLDPTLARSVPAILLALLAAVIYPILGLRRYRKIEHLPEPLPSRTRVRLYMNLIASQWLLVGLTWLLFRETHRPTSHGLGSSVTAVTPGYLAVRARRTDEESPG